MNWKRISHLILDSVLRTAAVAALVFGFAWLLVCWAGHRPALAANACGTIRLRADDAIIHGPPEIRLNTFAGERNIGWWDREDQSLSWTVDAGKGGRYLASLRYSRADAEPVEMALAIGLARLTAAVPGSGGWNRWGSIELGEIVLPAGKNQPVTLRCTGLRSQGVINFIELVMKPAG